MTTVSQSIRSCGTCGAPFTGDGDGKQLAEAKRAWGPYHACVSWTYVRGERADEALLRIRKELKQAAGWWTEQDQGDYDEAVPDA